MRHIGQWTVDPHRAVLLIHDLHGFFRRPFATGRTPVDTSANATRLRQRAASMGIPVAYTAPPDSKVPSRRRLKGEPLAPRTGDWLLKQRRHSAFSKTELRALMWRCGRDQLVLCGVYAHRGVLMTAVEAFDCDIQPFLVADAIADNAADESRLALDHVAGWCAVVSTTDDVLGQLNPMEAAS